jgi:hypothetical protein
MDEKLHEKRPRRPLLYVMMIIHAEEVGDDQNVFFEHKFSPKWLILPPPDLNIIK